MSACVLGHIQLFATLWAVAHQVPLSVGFSRKEYWSRLPFPSPGDLPDPGIEPGAPVLQANSLPSEPPELSKGRMQIDLGSSGSHSLENLVVHQNLCSS